MNSIPARTLKMWQTTMATTISLGRRTINIPNKVFLDANFLIDAATRSGRYHTAAKEMLFKLSAAANAGYVELCTSPTVVDEVWWVLAKLLYEDAHGEGNWGPLPKPQKKRAFQQFGSDIIRTTNLILQSPVIDIVDVTGADIAVAVRLVTLQGTSQLPHDAFHLAVMQRVGIQAIVTNDRDFRSLASVVALRFDIPATQL